MSYEVLINPKENGVFYDCYLWWRNFVINEADSCNDRESLFRKYHFTWKDNVVGSDFIIFDSEEHFTWFVLRWS